MHWYDLLPLALLALLFFGPKRLPEMGASIGKTIRNFQNSMREVTGSFESSLDAPPKQETPALPAATPAPVALPAASEPAAPAAPAAVVDATPAGEAAAVAQTAQTAQIVEAAPSTEEADARAGVDA